MVRSIFDELVIYGNDDVGGQYLYDNLLQLLMIGVIGNVGFIKHFEQSISICL